MFRLKTECFWTLRFWSFQKWGSPYYWRDLLESERRISFPDGWKRYPSRLLCGGGGRGVDGGSSCAKVNSLSRSVGPIMVVFLFLEIALCLKTGVVNLTYKNHAYCKPCKISTSLASRGRHRKRQGLIDGCATRPSHTPDWSRKVPQVCSKVYWIFFHFNSYNKSMQGLASNIHGYSYRYRMFILKATQRVNVHTHSSQEWYREPDLQHQTFSWCHPQGDEVAQTQQSDRPFCGHLWRQRSLMFCSI